jgi:hypothetical protein
MINCKSARVFEENEQMFLDYHGYYDIGGVILGVHIPYISLNFDSIDRVQNVDYSVTDSLLLNGIPDAKNLCTVTLDINKNKDDVYFYIEKEK